MSLSLRCFGNLRGESRRTARRPPAVASVPLVRPPLTRDASGPREPLREAPQVGRAAPRDHRHRFCSILSKCYHISFQSSSLTMYWSNYTICAMRHRAAAFSSFLHVIFKLHLIFAALQRSPNTRFVFLVNESAMLVKFHEISANNF